MRHLRNSRHCFLVEIFGVLIVFISALRVYVEARSSAKDLSEERSRAKCEKLIEVLLALSVIVSSKIWRQHVIHGV